MTTPSATVLFWLQMMWVLVNVGVAHPLGSHNVDTSGRISPYIPSDAHHAVRPTRVDSPPASSTSLSSSSSSSPSSPLVSISMPTRLAQMRTDDQGDDDDNDNGNDHGNAVMREKAMDQLLNVFGMGHALVVAAPTAEEVQRSAPPFMVNLYNSLADAESGVMFGRSPFNANTVRALPDTAGRHRHWFQFNLSQVGANEQLLQAELHLYRLRPRWRSADIQRPSFFQIHVYKLQSPDLSTVGARLIGLRLMSSTGTGWEIFNMRETVQGWLTNATSNFGIYVTVTSLSGKPLPDSLLRFGRRGRQEPSREPLLVLFTNDQSHPAGLRHSPVIVGSDAHNETENMASSILNVNDEATTPRERRRQIASTVAFHHAPSSEEVLRRKRSLVRKKGIAGGTGSPSQSSLCAMKDMFVNFSAIGWSNFVIAPKGYNAHRCKGKCSFPIGEDLAGSNHALVKSLANWAGLTDAPPPCCVPTELHPISLLFFDEFQNVVLKNIEKMIVGQCGCL